MKIIAVAKTTGIPYEANESDLINESDSIEFKNLHTGKLGKIPRLESKNYFYLNKDLQVLVHQNELILYLMSKLELVVK